MGYKLIRLQQTSADNPHGTVLNSGVVMNLDLYRYTSIQTSICYSKQLVYLNADFARCTCSSVDGLTKASSVIQPLSVNPPTAYHLFRKYGGEIN